jgi:hypothetical protein
MKNSSSARSLGTAAGGAGTHDRSFLQGPPGAQWLRADGNPEPLAARSVCEVTVIDREVAMIDHEVMMIDHEVVMFDREVAMIDREVAMIDREVAMIDHEVVMFDREVVMIDRGFTMIDHDLTVIDHDLSVIDHDLTMERPRLPNSSSCADGGHSRGVFKPAPGSNGATRLVRAQSTRHRGRSPRDGRPCRLARAGAQAGWPGGGAS